MSVYFCPKCRRLAVRVEEATLVPAVWMSDQDEFFAISDEEIEEGMAIEQMVRVMIAPAWRTALVIPPGNVRNISFGCPWRRCKGKIVLFKE